MGTYVIYVSIDRGPFEPYELEVPLYDRKRAELIAARFNRLSPSGRYRYEVRTK